LGAGASELAEELIEPDQLVGGPGIPAQSRELVLEPFVRLDDSCSPRTGGAGLGLAVVRALVEAHRGTVRISDAPAGGGRLIVRLPLFG